MEPNDMREVDAAFKTRYGPFRLVAFEFTGGHSDAALVRGDLAREEHPLVRVQSACLTAAALAAVGCDCQDQLELAMRLIRDEGTGCVVHLDQEGMGHGLFGKVAMFRVMNSGVDTYEAAMLQGVEPDVRDYTEAAAIIRYLMGDRPIRLLTNNPEKEVRLRRAGVKIWESVPLEPDPTTANSDYLRVKKMKLHHRLSKV